MLMVNDDACGRYVLQTTAKDLAKRYNLAKAPAVIASNYNVAPGQTMPVVVEEDGKIKVELMKWGLIPVWAKDPAIGYRLINARDDHIFEKPMWRGVILKKRALIPATGFYEWQKPPAGSKQHKTPFYIHPKQIDLFSFAGVWSSWKDKDGKELKTYSIITTQPNKEMAKVHNRMPVILRQSDEADWLEPSKAARQDVEPFLHPFEDHGLQMYKVSTEVNSTRNNNKDLLAPLST